MIQQQNRDGVIVVNKPRGFTSHDVVAVVRRRLDMKKVGHAGTLDPIATGVLVILVGKATRLFDVFLRYEKEYAATLRLGIRTDSGDSSGKIVEEKDYRHISEDAAHRAFARYVGDIMQIPPMFSAVKHKGKRLYRLALKGQEVQRQPRLIRISDLRITGFSLPDISFSMRCSKGTYVRQLAQDVARDMGSVAHITQLERRAVGPFTIEQAVDLDKVDPSHIRPFYANFSNAAND